MDYPFRMYGETVEVYHYQIDYTVQNDTDGDPASVTEYATTREEAQAIADQHGGTVTIIDASSYEWMDGLTFSTRDAAIASFDLGETAYLETANQPTTGDRIDALESAIEKGLAL